MNHLKSRNALMLSTLAMAAVLSACGGGGADAGTSPFNTGTTQTTATESVAAISVEAPTSVTNGGVGEVVVTVTAVNASRKVMQGVPIEFVDLDSSVIDTSSGTAVTGANGTYTTTFRVLQSNKANRDIKIRVRAGGKVELLKTVFVTGSEITGTLQGGTLVAGTQSTISYVLKDSVANPIAGASYQIQNTDGFIVATGVTDANGGFSYSFTPTSAQAGATLRFTAVASGVQKEVSATVQATAAEPSPVNIAGLSLNLQVNPISVPVNRDGSEANTATVLATAKDANGNPVQNVRVLFKLGGNTVKEGRFTIGGNATSGSTVGYTGANGQLETRYIPGSTPTATQALQVVACFGGTLAEAQACTTTDTKSITVTGTPVSVFLGSDGTLDPSVGNNLLYARNYVVQVVDSSGRAISNVRVAADLNTLDYRKGSYTRENGQWTVTPSAGPQYLVCAKEDLDDDDDLDAGEDINRSGKLEPVRAAVALDYVSNGNTTGNFNITNEQGLVFLRLSYPKSVASWMSVELIATAIVNNSEGRDRRTEVLRVLNADITAEAAPAFVVSPFGTVVSNAAYSRATFPDGSLNSGAVLAPCSNPE